MAWVRIHDGAMTHPKIIGLSDKAFRLWVWGLSYAQQHLTDGLLVADAIPTRLKRATGDLTAKHLWEAHAIGFKVHDYLEWNESRDAVLNKREQAKHRYRRWEDQRDNASATEANKRVYDPSETTRLRTSHPNATRASGVGKSGSLPGKGSGENPDEDAVAERAGRLREELYPAWYAKYRHGARLRLVGNALEFEDAVSICRTWDDDRIEKLARIFLTTDEDWISKTDRNFRLFATRATWCDDRLRQAEQRPA